VKVKELIEMMNKCVPPDYEVSMEGCDCYQEPFQLQIHHDEKWVLIQNKWLNCKDEEDD